jgi:hypothetical protein
MITVMKEANHKQLHLFRKVQGIEKALIQQIVKAVEAPPLLGCSMRSSQQLPPGHYQPNH